MRQSDSRLPTGMRRVYICRSDNPTAERIEDGLDLPAALVRAVDVIRTEQRQVLLDLRTVVSDMH